METQEQSETQNYTHAFSGAANPVLVEDYRGDILDYVHRGSLLVMNQAEDIICSFGQVDSPFYFRSSLNFIEALLLFETGAAARLSLTPEECALACGSHAGELAQVQSLRNWMTRLGCSEADLLCPSVLPFGGDSADGPSIFNNPNAGRHLALLSVITHLGLTKDGYMAPSHPVQKMVVKTIARVMGLPVEKLIPGLSDCGLPAYAFSLQEVCRGYARFMGGGNLPHIYRDGATALMEAALTHPAYLGGERRFDTEIMTAVEGLLLKEGGGGTHVAFWPEKNVTVALKMDDPVPEAKYIAILTILYKLGLLGEDLFVSLKEWVMPDRYADDGEVVVGHMQPAASFVHQETPLI